MEKVTNSWAWVAVLVCVLLSTAADSLSTQAWKTRSWTLAIAVTVLSPFVFLAFGYIGQKFGLSIASSLTNSLIVIGPIIVGLLLFREWERLQWPVYIGMALIVIGITVIVIYKDAGS